MSAETIENDDAVVDCIVYTLTSEDVPLDQRLRLTRRVVNSGADNKDCSVTMCGNDDDPANQMLRYCENGHYLHDICLEYIMSNAESLHSTVCPQCRSSRAFNLMTRANPIPNRQFTIWFSPEETALNIIECAASESLRLLAAPPAQ